MKATNRVIEFRVDITHWWPGRVYDRGCFPFVKKWLIRWLTIGTRYATVATCEELNLMTMAECCPKDFPTRQKGREIALNRMRKELEEIRWMLAE